MGYKPEEDKNLHVWNGMQIYMHEIIGRCKDIFTSNKMNIGTDNKELGIYAVRKL